MPVPPEPQNDSWWRYTHKPAQRVWVFATATNALDNSERMVIYLEEEPPVQIEPRFQKHAASMPAPAQQQGIVRVASAPPAEPESDGPTVMAPDVDPTKLSSKALAYPLKLWYQRFTAIE